MKAANGRTYMQVRIDSDLLKRVDEECESRMISRAWLITKVLQEWLETNEGVAS